MCDNLSNQVYMVHFISLPTLSRHMVEVASMPNSALSTNRGRIILSTEYIACILSTGGLYAMRHHGTTQLLYTRIHIWTALPGPLVYLA